MKFSCLLLENVFFRFSFYNSFHGIVIGVSLTGSNNLFYQEIKQAISSKSKRVGRSVSAGKAKFQI